MPQLKELPRGPGWAPKPFSEFAPWTSALQEFMNAPFFDERGHAHWNPTIDVTETDGSYVFKAEVPGIAPESIEINVTENSLTLSGEKTQEEKREVDNYVQTERRYGAFQRSFTFPQAVDAQHVTAEAKDGVLTVTVGKATPSHVRKVKVKVR